MQLSYFLAVCKHGNMTKAATELYVSQPSVTEAVKSLEAELNTALFVRHKKQLSLTREGMSLYYLANDVMDRMDTLNKQMLEIGNAPKSINVGISTFCAFLMPALKASFQKVRADVDLHFFSFGTYDLERYVLNHSLDVALSGPTGHRGLNRQTLFSVEPSFMTYEENPLAQQEFVRIPDDILEEPLILFKESAYSAQKIDDLARDALYNPAASNVIMTTNQLSVLKQYVSKRKASSLVIKTPDLIKDGLVFRPLRPQSIIRMHIIWDEDNPYTHISDFVHFVVEHIKGLSEQDLCLLDAPFPKQLPF